MEEARLVLVEVEVCLVVDEVDEARLVFVEIDEALVEVVFEVDLSLVEVVEVVEPGRHCEWSKFTVSLSISSTIKSRTCVVIITHPASRTYCERV